MTYVIVNPETGKEYKLTSYSSCARYETESGAKSALTRAKKSGKLQGVWHVMDSSEWITFKNIKFPVKMVKRVNLMSGLEFEEPENTPYFCSPASESYWSM